MSLQQRRLPSSLRFACKAAEKKHAAAFELIGEILLAAGLHSAAETVASNGSAAASVALAITKAGAIAAMQHRPQADTRAACEGADKLLRSASASATNTAHALAAARLHELSGSPTGMPGCTARNSGPQAW